MSMEAFHRHDQEVDRPRADGTAARQRHAGLAHAGEEGPEHPEAGAHARDELIGCGGVDDGAGVEAHGLPRQFHLARALAGDGDVDAVIAEDARQQRDVGEARHISQRQHVFGQQTRDHQGQCGILRAGNRNDALKRRTAGDLDAVHVLSFEGAAARSPEVRPARPGRISI
jgi:hypothetical protein